MMRMSALATTAPVGSTTVPLIAPVAPPWANVWVRSRVLRNTIQNVLRKGLDIHSSPTRGPIWLGLLSLVEKYKTIGTTTVHNAGCGAHVGEHRSPSVDVTGCPHRQFSRHNNSMELRSRSTETGLRVAPQVTRSG